MKQSLCSLQKKAPSSIMELILLPNGHGSYGNIGITHDKLV
jgi:hypothetical protein